MNPPIGQELLPHYHLSMVLLSYLFACAGSLMGLFCARHMIRRDGTQDQAMLLAGAVTLGGVGIWCTHFIGMVTYRLPVPIRYDPFLTVLSLVVAVCICGIALHLSALSHRKRSTSGWLLGSALAGMGVCVMHYMGMFAMQMRADIHWNLLHVTLSALIAIVVSGAALRLAFRLRTLSHQITAAMMMGAAICGMHYIGMDAATMISKSPQALTGVHLSGAYLGLMVLGVASGVLIVIGWLVSERSAALNKPLFQTTALQQEDV